MSLGKILIGLLNILIALDIIKLAITFKELIKSLKEEKQKGE